MANKKPLICWVCDVPGWAFDKIAVEFSARLKSFNHITLYIGCTPDVNKSIRDVEEIADVIVCFYPPWMRLFRNLNKVVVRFDSYRALEMCGLV